MPEPLHNFAIIYTWLKGELVQFAGEAINVPEKDALPYTVYISLRCVECGFVSIIPGHISEITDIERSMGTEIIYHSDHQDRCEYCETEMRGIVEYSEYPKHEFQPYQFTPEKNVEYVPIPGLMGLLSDLGIDSADRKPKHLQDQLSRDIVDPRNEDLPAHLTRILDSDSTTVLLLGSYGNEGKSDLFELRQILRDDGFEAFLLEDFPDPESESLQGKSILAMKLVDFSIMLDDKPSGAIDEYRLAQITNSVLARLVPESGGSTVQIGGIELADINHINTFVFHESPTKVLPDAIKWAKEHLEERSKQFNQLYGWRGASED